MLTNIIHTIKYHNITPIAVAFVLLGATGALASEDVRHAVVGERVEEVKGVDNAALLSLNVDTLDQQIRITDVSETNDAYQVAYEFETFDVRAHTWGEVTKQGTITVEKKALGGRDLGVYVQKELGEILDAHTAYLAKAKKRAEESGRTKPTRTTSYTKLAGLVFDAQSRKIEGYEPVVKQPEPPEQPTTDPVRADVHDDVGTISNGAGNEQQTTNTKDEASDEDGSEAGGGGGSSSTGSGSLSSTDGTAASTTAPTITITGNNPAHVEVGTSYNDLGATVTDDQDDNLGIKASVNGTDVGDLSNVTIDTSTTSEHTIEYRATDNDGNTSTATRTVIVGEEASEAGGSSGEESDTSGSQTSTTTEEAADATAPEITLDGSTSIGLTVGDSYTDPGYSASDDTDGDITSDVVVGGDAVDTSTAGEYIVTYSVSDSAGNAAEEKARTITVVEPEPQEESSSTPDNSNDEQETATNTPTE